MMRNHIYPDWVDQYRTKGTSVKKVGENYYLYRTSSRRVPGKSYPVTRSEYIGLLTPNGIDASGRKRIKADTCEVYEYGFSYCLDRLAYPAFAKTFSSSQEARYAFLEVIRKCSRSSYLLKEKAAVPADLHLNVSLQRKKLERFMGMTLQEMEPLKYVYAVCMDQHRMLASIPIDAQNILERLKVDLDGTI